MRSPSATTASRFMVPDARRRLARGDLGRVRDGDPRRGAVPRGGGPRARRSRARSSRPTRVEWISAALAIQAAGGVDGADLPGAAPPSRRPTSSTHSDAKVLFVDTPELLARVLERVERARGVRRIVLLDDALDAARRPRSAARQAACRCRRSPRSSARSSAGRARCAIGAAREPRTPGAFERAAATPSRSISRR